MSLQPRAQDFLLPLLFSGSATDFVHIQARLNCISYEQLKQSIDSKRSAEDRKRANMNFALSNEISKLISVRLDYFQTAQTVANAIEDLMQN